MNNAIANHMSEGEFPQAGAGLSSTSSIQLSQDNLGSADVVKWTKEILQMNVCRICVTYHEAGPELVGLFAPRAPLRESFADLINKYLPIKVCESDELPRVVCRACACRLTDWHGMVRACLDSAALLAAHAHRLAAPGRSIVTPDRNDKCASPASSGGCDSDGAPLGALVARDPLAELRRALRALRDHVAVRHARPRHRHTDSGAESGPEDEGRPAEATPDEGEDPFDDLTRNNRRRDRFDAATRRALEAAREREAGRTYYRCGACGRRVGSAHALVQHARIHSGARPAVCHVCGAAFRAQPGLARHLAQTHERARRATCPLCRNTFANKQNLRQHLRTHTGERPYACAAPGCGKTFAQSGALHAHARTHRAARDFVCPECGAAFRLRAGLARHAARHAGARPHRCACGRAFASRHELRAHAAVHADAAPHACAACPAAYKQRRALRDHVRRAHPPALAPAPALYQGLVTTT